MESSPDSRSANDQLRQALPDALQDFLKKAPPLVGEDFRPLGNYPPPPSNHEVLGCVEDEYPQTLHDLDSKVWWLRFGAERNHTYKDYFAYIQNYGFLTEVRHDRSFHDSLPALDSAPYDVWLLTSTRCTTVEAVRHWSIYTQDHLFHLRAGKRNPHNIFQQSGISENISFHTNYIRRCLHLNRAHDTEIHSSVEPLGVDNNVAVRKHSNPRQKFIAYHVGRTHYSVQQVTKLADAIIHYMKSTIGTYNVFENNCQHYVLSLMRRIVMTQRHCMAVCGTRKQIVMYAKGHSDYILKPWLTKTKARLLFLPITKSLKKRPKKYWTTGIFYRPYDDRPWPVWLQGIIFENKLWDIAAAVCHDKNHLEQFKVQCKIHFGDHQGWAAMDQYTYSIWYFVCRVIIGLIKEALAAEAVLGVVNGGAATAAVSVDGPAILAGGMYLALYIVLTRMFLARGSLTVKHFDIECLSDPVSRSKLLRRQIGRLIVGASSYLFFKGLREQETILTSQPGSPSLAELLTKADDLSHQDSTTPLWEQRRTETEMTKSTTYTIESLEIQNDLATREEGLDNLYDVTDEIDAEENLISEFIVALQIVEEPPPSSP